MCAVRPWHCPTLVRRVRVRTEILDDARQEHVAESARMREVQSEESRESVDEKIIRVGHERKLEELDEAGRERFAKRLAHLEKAEMTESQRLAFEADVEKIRQKLGGR